MGFFYILHIIVCVILIAIILFQDGKSGGLVSVSDTSQSMFGARGATSFLTKLTSGIAIAFMVSSLFLAYNSGPDNSSIASDYVPEATETDGAIQPATAAGGAPGADSNQMLFTIDKDGNRVPISVDQAAPQMETFTGTDALPEDLRKLEEERLAKERDKAAAEAQAAQDKTDEATEENQN
jgi:preprotein translocase subunit SecG